MKKGIYRILTLVLALMMVLGLAACGDSGSAGNADDTLYIGLAVPLTGDSAMYGETVRDGVQFGVDEINANGGIDGKQVVLVIEDDKGNNSEAAMVAQKLAEDDRLFSHSAARSNTSE